MNIDTYPDEKSRRFVAILNKKVETGKLMNALGHMAAGLAGGNNLSKQMCFLQYQDKDQSIHPNISHFPFIVLKADNSNQIRTVRSVAIAKKISYSDFTSSMTVGTSKEQLKVTKETPQDELEYYGICLFSETNTLKEFTQKFTLFK